MIPTTQLTEWYDAKTGALKGANPVQRRLSDLRGCYADSVAFAERLSQDDPLLYAVAAVDSFNGEGDLHYGIGVLYPGKIGAEYYLTKGHLHSWRPAAEVYIGLSGKGVMLLEDEQSGESRIEQLGEGSIVYVPGHTAHRTMNVGDEPLVYIGVYPQKAGHDYGAIAEKNFRMVVVEQDGEPKMIERSEWLRTLSQS